MQTRKFERTRGVGISLVDELLIQLLALLDYIIFLQQLLQRKVLRIEQIFDR